MAAFRGKDVVVKYNAVNISGEGRSVSFEQSSETLDDTVYGDANRTKIAGLLDGSGSFEAIDSTGDFTAAWDQILPGTSATMLIQPEGTASTKRQLSFTAVVTTRSISFPYDDLVTFSMAFEISGVVDETNQT